MTNNTALIHEVKHEAFKYECENILENIEIYLKFLNCYLKANLSFEKNCFVTSNAIQYYNEFKHICDIEKNLINEMLYNINDIDQMMALEYMDTLSFMKENLVNYYNEVFDNIMEACTLNRPFRSLKSPKDFITLEEDLKIQKDIHSLCYNIKDILNYFSIQDYYDELMEKVLIIECHKDEDFEFVGLYYDKDKYRLILPEIIDYNTLLININLISRAYQYSLTKDINTESLGKEYERNFKF